MNTAVSETYFLVTPGGSDRHRALFCLTSLLSPRIPANYRLPHVFLPPLTSSVAAVPFCLCILRGGGFLCLFHSS